MENRMPYEQAARYWDVALKHCLNIKGGMPHKDYLVERQKMTDYCIADTGWTEDQLEAECGSRVDVFLETEKSVSNWRPYEDRDQELLELETLLDSLKHFAGEAAEFAQSLGNFGEEEIKLEKDLERWVPKLMIAYLTLLDKRAKL